MRRVLLLPTALLLAGCGAAGPSRGPASAPVLPDAPAPPIAAAAAPAPDWVLGLLHPAANAGVSSTEGWSCFVRAVPAGSTVPATQQCGPPTPAQKAEVEAQRKAHEAAMQPVAGSEPRVVATLGSFATTLLSGRALGITRVHGQEQEVTLGARSVRLVPLYHPAAALYTPTMLEVLEQDVARLGEILGRPAPSRTPAAPEWAETERSRGLEPAQLGLF